MITNKIPKEIQQVWDNKVKEIVKELDRQGFQSPAIVYILRRTKGRVSQILNEGKGVK
jgi:uncharacterized protein (UPF0335 family)